MKLSKTIMSLICLSFIILAFATSSVEMLSSINIIDKGVDTIVMSITEKKTQEEIDKDLEEKILKKEREEQIAKEQEAIQLEQKRVDNVTYLRENITIPSGLKENEMKAILLTYKGAHTMAHLSDSLIKAEKEYGVNAFAVAAIVALESGFATSRRAMEDNNLTGYEVYSDSSEGRLFKSQHDSILHTARHLSENYLTEGAMHYNGLSVDAVQVKYCPDEGKNKKWEEKIDSLASGFLKTYKNLYL